MCHRCHSFDLRYEETAAEGVIYSHQRVWHPVHPALAEQGPYVVVLVELPQADNVRLVGNLIGDPHQPLEIGAAVHGVFEHHDDDDPAHTLLQWAVSSASVTVTAALCERMVELRNVDIGPAARTAAARLMLDGLAVAVAGSVEPAIGLLAEHQRDLGSTPAATVLGLGWRTGTVAAAALNGAAMHVLDFEPMWSPANHALSTTLPAVLALAEVLDVTGTQALAALVHGVELQGWLRQASRQWEARDLQFHPPGVVGPLGAAAAAAQLLRLDSRQLRHALGIAASRSGALMANVGTMTKATHCGHAAASGLEAALLAARGFTANPDIFDHAQGFGAFSPDFVAADLLGLGPPWRAVDPGYAIKLFPCQYGTHFGISAALALRRRIADVNQIDAVRLTTPVMGYVDRPRPETGLAGKFSLQYTVAAALLDGFVGLDTFSDERLHRPDMARLLALTEVIQDPAIPARFEDMHVVLDVDVAGGGTVREHGAGPPGIWGSPPISAAEHHQKVQDCLAVALGPDEVDRVVGLVGRFETLSGAEVRDLIAMVGGRPGPDR